MGCDIHTIVEIKRNGKWEYIPELPEAFNNRSYGVFSILNNNVRNYDGKDGFEGKGLPNDISGRQYGFCSLRNELERAYNRSTSVCWIESENRHISIFDDSLREEIDAEFYEELKSGMTKEQALYYYNPTQTSYPQKYYVQNAHKVNGIFVEIPYNQIYKTIEEFNKMYYRYHWHEKENDYGYYEVDFDSNDYHSYSYLNLTELLTKVVEMSGDKAFDVPKEFLIYLRNEIGELPDTMIVKEKNETEATITFDVDSYDVYAQEAYNGGVAEIASIKEKYNIESNDDIRIVFAFDS